jgi:hypothetical protein
MVADDRIFAMMDDQLAVVDVAESFQQSTVTVRRLREVQGAFDYDSNTVFGAARGSGLFIHDLNGASGEYMRTRGQATDVAHHGTTYAVADGPAGVTFYQLDASGLTLVGSLNPGLYVRTVSFSADGVLWGAGRDDGSQISRLGPITLFALDVSNPAEPSMLDWIDLPGSEPGRPTTAGTDVWLPVGTGVHQIDAKNRRRLEWIGTAVANNALDSLPLTVGGDSTLFAAMGPLGVGGTSY